MNSLIGLQLHIQKGMKSDGNITKIKRINFPPAIENNGITGAQQSNTASLERG